MAQPIVSKTIVTENSANRIDISVRGVGDISIALGDLTPDVVTYAALHGLAQKIGDAAAIERNTETGLAATPEDKFNAMKAVADHLLSGGWNRRSEGGAGEGGLLVAALMRITGKARPEVEEFVAGMDKKTQAAMRLDPEVKPTIDAIRAERAPKTPDPAVSATLAAFLKK